MSDGERANSALSEISSNIEVHIPQASTSVDETHQQQRSESFEELKYKTEADHQNSNNPSENDGAKDYIQQQNEVAEQAEECTANQQNGYNAGEISQKTDPEKSDKQGEVVADKVLTDELPREQDIHQQQNTVPEQAEEQLTANQRNANNAPDSSQKTDLKESDKEGELMADKALAEEFLKEQDIQQQQNLAPEQPEEELTANQKNANNVLDISQKTNPEESDKQRQLTADNVLAEKFSKEQTSHQKPTVEEGSARSPSEQLVSPTDTDKQSQNKAKVAVPEYQQQEQHTPMANDADEAENTTDDSPVDEMAAAEEKTAQITITKQDTELSHIEGDQIPQNQSSKELSAESQKDISLHQVLFPSAGVDAINQKKPKDKKIKHPTDDKKNEAEDNSDRDHLKQTTGPKDPKKIEQGQPSQRKRPEGGKDDNKRSKMVAGTVTFQEKDKNEITYMTETPAEETYRTESRTPHTYSPAYIDTGSKRSSEGERKKKKEKIDPVRAQALARLRLSKPPSKYQIKLRPMKVDPDPSNKAPLNPNIYYTEVPKEGGHVKTPFYMQVDIPEGTLEGNVRLKFERQEYDRMKLGLTHGDTLCSCIVDLNMEPLSYCLRGKVTVRMRILDKCINKHEDIIIITARHFSWIRIPTKIESKNINGEKHYYAVTRSQSFGKFAVISTQKMDRFVITNAGGTFKSTIVPEIQLQVDEHHLSDHPPQLIEMVVWKTRDDAIKQVTEEIPQVQDVEGRLVAASPLIEINKDVMGQSGHLQFGIQFPDKLSLKVPVPTPVLISKGGMPPKRRIVIMQKMLTNPNYNTVNGHRYRLSAYSKSRTHLWDDITEDSRMSVDAVNFAPNEVMNIKVSAPGKFMVLVFEEDNSPPQKGAETAEADIDDLMNAIINENRAFRMNIMVHQKILQPSIILIHMVTSDAVDPICETMQSTKLWKNIYISRKIIMREWQPVRLQFSDDLQPTVNQISPHLRFYSRRWQGYQIQLEATDKAFKTPTEKYTGEITFVEKKDDISTNCKSIASIENDIELPESNVLCIVDIEIEKDQAKPFHPTVVVKKVPKVPIYREYKMKWLGNLSKEEIERYRSAHGI